MVFYSEEKRQRRGDLSKYFTAKWWQTGDRSTADMRKYSQKAFKVRNSQGKRIVQCVRGVM